MKPKPKEENCKAFHNHIKCFHCSPPSSRHHPLIHIHYVDAQDEEEDESEEQVHLKSENDEDCNESCNED